MRKASQPLVDAEKVTPAYVDDIVAGVRDLGPYIVIAPHVALPHARPESGAIEPAIGGRDAQDPHCVWERKRSRSLPLPLSATDNDGTWGASFPSSRFSPTTTSFASLDGASTPAEVVELINAREGRL